MTDSIDALILRIVPSDGTTIGNGRVLEGLKRIVPTISEQEYWAARDAMVESGVLGKGRGRGGAVYLITSADKPAPQARVVEVVSNDDDAVLEAGDDLTDGDADTGDEDAADETEDDEAAEDAFTLTSPTDPEPKKRRTAAVKKPTNKNKTKDGAQVISYRHLDKRVNNPEVGMVHPENDPDKPKTVWAYDPHIDPSLNFDIGRSKIEKLIDDALSSGDPERMRDALMELKNLQSPYLNWSGKAERTSFEVDTVSLHVHERIDPASILSAVRKRIKGEKGLKEKEFQPDLFDAPFENLPLRQAIDFYRHEKNWSNRLIAGDSLLVMNSLIQKESMAGRVQMVFIDPPYGIKYGSNFQPFTNKREVKDGADSDLTQEPEMIKAFRDTWELGIHSYLTYLRDRLLVAKDLLTESGSIFVQISDDNEHTVRNLLDDVFGKKQFVSLISFQTTSGFAEASGLSRTGDYVIWYAKNRDELFYSPLYEEQDTDLQSLAGVWLITNNGAYRGVSKKETRGEEKLPSTARLYIPDNLLSQGAANEEQTYEYHKKSYDPGANSHWKPNFPAGLDRLSKSYRLHEAKSSIRYRRYIDDFPFKARGNLWTDTLTGSFTEAKQYVVQTNPKVIERCLLMTTSPGDLVVDPTCGSGTTAYVSEKWGRRWITCDTSRVAITLAKQRLMTSCYDYYIIRYPHEGLRGGFIYRAVPHITLKSIANNPEIDEIYENTHTAIDASLTTLNAILKTAPPFMATQGFRKGKKVVFTKGETLNEWEVPFDWPEDWPDAAKPSFDAFHASRQMMLRAMDQSISAHAEPETLYDQPEIDRNKLRITGPFSVEAVPNPTVMALNDVRPADEADVAVARSGETSRQGQWRDELMKTGIRGKGGQMLKFAEVEPIPGLRYLHATGTFAESGDRVVVSFGPEHAALEQRQVELALSEAEKLRPAPKFVVFCSFTFDPEAAKDIDEVNWPGVTLLKAQMNTDLLTEDLKKARSSNQSFWLMGQPDVDVRKRSDGLWEVEVNGFDYFDPKAGELVSGGKSKIAMWSLDTDYDQRSLFPHQVFFPMAGKKEGWSRLKKTIRAELDEDMLDRFHGTISLPFSAGDNKCVAVKIVDDRGIESLKIASLA